MNFVTVTVVGILDQVEITLMLFMVVLLIVLVTS